MRKLVKTYVDFELRQPLDKTADEAIEEIIEELLDGSKNKKAEEIQALAKAVKDIAVAKAVLSRIKNHS